MKTRLLALAFLLLLPLHAFADPVFYNMSFTANPGSAPSAGSFFYDAESPAFSNFVVTVGHYVYDLTLEANTMQRGILCCGSIGGNPPCVEGLSGAAAAFKLLDGTCSSQPGSLTIWLSVPHEIDSGFFYMQVVGPNDIVRLKAFSAPAPPFLPSASGSGWTISVSEPLSAATFLIGALVAGCALVRGKSQCLRLRRE